MNQLTNIIGSSQKPGAYMLTCSVYGEVFSEESNLTLEQASRFRRQHSRST